MDIWDIFGPCGRGKITPEMGCNGVPDLTAIKKGHAEKLLNFGCQLWMCVVCVDMC